MVGGGILAFVCRDVVVDHDLGHLELDRGPFLDPFEPALRFVPSELLAFHGGDVRVGKEIPGFTTVLTRDRGPAFAALGPEENDVKNGFHG